MSNQDRISSYDIIFIIKQESEANKKNINKGIITCSNPNSSN